MMESVMKRRTVTPYSSQRARCFGGTNYFCLQGWWVNQARNKQKELNLLPVRTGLFLGFTLQPWWWRQYVLFEHQALSELHSVRTLTTDRTSNPAVGTTVTILFSLSWGRIFKVWCILRGVSNTQYCHILCYFKINIFLRFVLLKEKNMLLTMEHECKEQTELFPNPERIDKVSNFIWAISAVMLYLDNGVIKIKYTV